jgi:hypothetical protein
VRATAIRRWATQLALRILAGSRPSSDDDRAEHAPVSLDHSSGPRRGGFNSVDRLEVWATVL